MKSLKSATWLASDYIQILYGEKTGNKYLSQINFVAKSLCGLKLQGNDKFGVIVQFSSSVHSELVRYSLCTS